MKYIILIGLLLSCLIIPITSTAQNELEEEVFLMTFVPNIQFSPTYVAIEAGYFATAGFDVSVEYLDEPQVVDLVATGANRFGLVSGEQVILATSQGRPVIYVYEWFQQFPIGIVYSDSLEVESINDLVGQRFGIPGRFGATYSGFVTLLESAEIEETDIILDEIGFAAPEVFCVGAIDASVIYINNEPLQIRNRAQNGDCGAISDVNVLQIGEVIDLVSNGVITNQDMITNNPARVTAFINAYDQGLASTINNPARAYLLSSNHIESLLLDDDFRVALETLANDQDAFLMTMPNRDEVAQSRTEQREFLSQQFDANILLQFDILLASIELWDADQLGFTDEESWINMQDTLLALGQLGEAADISDIFTNDFLPTNDE